jgi:hypothetical protein
LENAQRARTLLGPGVWSRIIRVENSADHSVYPRTVYALVFELSGILWFYTDTNGTQSFSLHRHSLLAEKADFTPLLRDIELGFESYEIVPGDKTRERQGSKKPLPFGCLIESVAAARALIDRGEPMQRVELVWFYFNAYRSLQGHTVLAYEGTEGAYLVDPAYPTRRLRVGEKLPDEPMVLAQSLKVAGLTILKARQLSIPLPRPTAIALAESREATGESRILVN